jgi:hypothetical protein
MDELGHNLCARKELNSKFRFDSTTLFIRGLVMLNG